mmetsp:Transcript_15449/g.32041  ORF Transcript_15449/g.32041 Transcript_15449/m.32041 type:complete len:203 (-) Transcript_15449:687-1295(-)
MDLGTIPTTTSAIFIYCTVAILIPAIHRRQRILVFRIRRFVRFLLFLGLVLVFFLLVFFAASGSSSGNGTFFVLLRLEGWRWRFFGFLFVFVGFVGSGTIRSRIVPHFFCPVVFVPCESFERHKQNLLVVLFLRCRWFVCELRNGGCGAGTAGDFLVLFLLLHRGARGQWLRHGFWFVFGGLLLLLLLSCRRFRRRYQPGES